MRFRFPIYHDRCEICESRFICWTNCFNCDTDTVVSVLIQNLPRNFSLKCIIFEPYSEVSDLRLWLDLDDKYSLSWTVI